MAQPKADGISANSPNQRNEHKNEIKKGNVITPLSKIIHIKKQINIWIANVCSLSGKTDKSAMRKDFLIEKIKMDWPDIVILLETNHTNEPSLLPEFYDNFHTPVSNSQGVIILAKKLFGFELIAALNFRGLVIKSRIIKDFKIIGIYNPYYDMFDSTIEFLKTHQTNYWFIGGDLESFGPSIIKHLEPGFWSDIDYTRESNESQTQTEYAGYFYNKPIIKRLEKISDHFLIECNIDTKWDGVEISFPQQIVRNKAICTVMNYNSKATSELLAEWPEKPFKTIVTGLIPMKTRSIKIYRHNISFSNISQEIANIYRKEKNKQIQKTINDALKSNDLKIVANLTSKILHIARKYKSFISLLGITGPDEKIYVGENSIKLIKSFYTDLFGKEPKTKYTEKSIYSPIEFNDRLFDESFKKLSLKKAMGYDQFPDELLKLPYIKNKFKTAFIIILSTYKIPDYLKYGRLILLSKEKKNAFPQIDNTRPIVILSALYKLIEIYWISNTKKIIWKKIGIHQTGFREKGSCQFNICRLKYWLKREKKAAVLFLDIQKAYDHVIREKLYDLLLYIGISSNFVKLYIELTTNMRLYINDEEYINYTSGLPQGSCISPILFNIYYEEALKKITPFTELLLGFADDVAIGIKATHELEQIQNVLKTWEPDYNLYVHSTKTKCVLYNQQKLDKLIYPISETFKYLGIDIYNTKSQFTKTFILKHISDISKKCKSLFIRNFSMKINKLTIHWWFLSKLFYDQISNIFLEYISIPEFVKIMIAKIKGILKINKNVPQRFVTNLLNFDIEKTIQNMISKMHKNCPFKFENLNELNEIMDPVSEAKKQKENQYWNYVLTTLNINVNSLYSLFTRTWYEKREGKYKCKKCNMDLSLFHLHEAHAESYPFLKTEEFKWIIEISETYDFKTSLIKRNIDKENACFWIKSIVEEAQSNKQKAIKEFGILMRVEYIPKKKKTKQKTKKNKLKMQNEQNNVIKCAENTSADKMEKIVNEDHSEQMQKAEIEDRKQEEKKQRKAGKKERKKEQKKKEKKEKKK